MARMICSLCLLLSFSSQAKSVAHTSPYVDLPQGCFTKKTFPCALRSTAGALKFESVSGSYFLGDLSSVRFTSANQIQLLSGSLWIERSQQLEFVANPELTLKLAGEFFLEKQKAGMVLVRNLNGVVEFDSRFLFKAESLPLGFQNWYGTLTTQKQINRGVIRPIEVLPFLKVWQPVAGLSPAETKARVHVYKQSWAEGVEISSQFYKEVVERRLASQAELDQRRVDRQKAALNEQKRIRQMYRQKAGFDL